jgi:DNA (cytosine-5)-methyltransferase 1
MGQDNIKVVDIFAGPGGLGEGFASFCSTNKQCRQPFKIVLSAEKESSAHRTLTLRAFYRRFGSTKLVPEQYYQIVRGELVPGQLTGSLAHEWEEAEHEALLLELGPESDRLHAEIRARVRGDQPWVLIGGPPCQAYSLAGRSRNKGKVDYVAEKDKRHYLYREYLQILSKFEPPVFIMENVKGILTSKVDGQRIFSTILRDLHDPGTALTDHQGALYDIYPLSADAVGGPYPSDVGSGLDRYLVRAEDLGIPQARHRVILLGIKRGAGMRRPGVLKSEDRVHVGDVIRDLSKLRSGLSKGPDSSDRWLDVVEDQRNLVLKALRNRPALMDAADAVRYAVFLRDAARTSTKKPDQRVHIEHATWYHDPRLGVTLNHDTRGHMPEDLGRYLYCAAFAATHEGKSPSSDPQEFPEALAPKHKNWEKGDFANRFRVQTAGRPSATVVSHISKDGHYFIHPDLAQCRSYTVREAARAQTFPDNYYFTGGRTDQYVQVGNAVPPLLAHKIAEIVWNCMK